jgi:preprotein translocase subunit YajC
MFQRIESNNTQLPLLTRLGLQLGVLALMTLPALALAQDGPVKAAAAPAGGGAPAGAGYLNILLLVGMFFFMWLFIIRPQAKRQKEHKQFLEKLVSGQEVVTSGGLIGKISSVQDTVVTLDLGHGTVKILKSAVSGELGQPAKSV